MKIKITQAGRYNDLTLTAIDCEVGQVLETHDWYGEELAGLGLAEVIPGTEIKAKVRMPRRTTVDTTSGTKTKTTHVALPPNPFINPVQSPLVADQPVTTPAEEHAGQATAGEPTGQPAEGEGGTVSDVENSTQSDPTPALAVDGEGGDTTAEDDEGKAGGEEPGE